MRTYLAELEKLDAKYKRERDKLLATEAVAQILEDTIEAIPAADSPELSWGMFGSWNITTYPLELPRVTDALKVLMAGGFRFTTPFPKEVTHDSATAYLKHEVTGVRLMFQISFGLSTTCKMEPTGEIEERAPVQKMRLVCSSPTNRQISLPQPASLEVPADVKPRLS